MDLRGCWRGCNRRRSGNRAGKASAMIRNILQDAVRLVGIDKAVWIA